jgi:hypothetical protein
VSETLPALAVSIADWAELTAAAVAVKVALVALAGTVSDAGIVSAELLLERLTVNPLPGAGALRVTVHASVPVPENEVLVQVSPLSRMTGLNCNANVSEMPPALAVSVAVCVELTAVLVAVNPALEALAGTVMEAGTATAASLLERLTRNPPLGAGPLRVTVQSSAPAPVIAPVAHEKPVRVGVATAPVPLRVTTEVAPVDELLDMVTLPVTAPVAVGSNCTVTEPVCPGFKVAGKLAPSREKPAPLSVTELTVTASVPVDVRVTA